MTSKSPAAREKLKVICITCRFKGCVRNCRFEPVLAPDPPKAA